jgi:hypothetical protein
MGLTYDEDLTREAAMTIFLFIRLQIGTHLDYSYHNCPEIPHRNIDY